MGGWAKSKKRTTVQKPKEMITNKQWFQPWFLGWCAMDFPHPLVLGPPVVPFHPFLGQGPPTKID